MLHLIYYLNCLAQVEDVRVQNRQAFDLAALGELSSQGDAGAANEEGELEQDEDAVPQGEASHQFGKSFFEQNEYHEIEECDQNQEETQSDNPQASMRMGNVNTGELNLQQAQSFGVQDAVREYASESMFKAPDSDERAGYEVEIAANFDLKADEQENEKEMASRQREREQSAIRSLKNIYQNLIDEEDIIIEEESRDGISASKTNTASISDIQILKHHSNYSNNTG